MAFPTVFRSGWDKSSSAATLSFGSNILDGDIILLFRRSIAAAANTPAAPTQGTDDFTLIADTDAYRGRTFAFSTWTIAPARLTCWARTAVSSDSNKNFTWSAGTNTFFSGYLFVVVRGAQAVIAAYAEASSYLIQNNFQHTITQRTASPGDELFIFCDATATDGPGTPPSLTPTPPSGSSILYSNGFGWPTAQARIAGSSQDRSSGQSSDTIWNLYPGYTQSSTVSEKGFGHILVRLGDSPAAEGSITGASILGSAAPLGYTDTITASAFLPNIFGSVLCSSTHDFYDFLSDDPRHFYTMQLQTSAGPVRVPISSWQATLHVEDASFVQCVVPATDQWVDELGDAESFVIFRKTTLLDGREIEAALASAPLQTLSFAQGGFNSTATLQGYLTDLALDPGAIATPTLRDIQTVFTYADGIRVRCAIDWQLRPGMTCYYGTTPVVVEYINYYVTQGQAYMDVGGV